MQSGRGVLHIQKYYVSILICFCVSFKLKKCTQMFYFSFSLALIETVFFAIEKYYEEHKLSSMYSLSNT